VNSDEARDLFSEAYDDQLENEKKAAFDAALAEDPELAVEFAEFCDLLDITHADAARDAEPPRDLLPAIQKKIHIRSAGRFYRDGFAERMGARTLMPIVVGIIMLLILAVVLVGISFVDIDDASHTDAGTPTTDGGTSGN